MAQQTINIGSAPNDGTGDTLRTAMNKANLNFTEVYTKDAAQDGRLTTNEGNITTLTSRTNGIDTTITTLDTRTTTLESNTLKIPNGDKGDITVASFGASMTVDTNVITFAKFQQLTGDGFVGRSSSNTAGNTQYLDVATARTLLLINNVNNTSDAAKPISTATQTALDLKSNAALTILNTPGATYTPVLSDAGKYLAMSNATGITVTIPQNIFATGTRILFEQSAAGAVTFAPASGVTINSRSSLVTNGQWSVVTLVQVGTNIWTVYGNLV